MGEAGCIPLQALDSVRARCAFRHLLLSVLIEDSSGVGGEAGIPDICTLLDTAECQFSS